MDHASKYVAHDLPFVGDPVLQSVGARAGQLRAAIHRGLHELLSASRDRVVGSQFLMAFGILQRMLECGLSAEVLASKGRQRDSAILVLTLMELRLDLQYAAQDSTRASQWLSNADKGRKPWRVGAQIKAVFHERGERTAELANYQHFSMVKHGNPLGGIASFPAELSVDGMVLRADPDDKADVNLSISCLFGMGVNLRLAFVTAVDLLQATGAGIDQVTSEIDEAMAALARAHNDHIRDVVVSWLPPAGARDFAADERGFCR
jgi:hypothetical protein